MLKQALQGFVTMPFWEWIAVIFGVGYVVFASKESVWAWVFGFFGTLIYTVLFWNGALLSSAILNFYYMVMAIYGFYLWSRKKEESDAVAVHRLNKKIIKMILIGGVVGCVVIGYLFGEYFDAKMTYLDAFVFVFSLIATWLLAHKIIENWLIWIVVDSAGVYLYFQAGYYPTVLLFFLYIGLSIYAYLSWKKSLYEVQNDNVSDS